LVLVIRREESIEFVVIATVIIKFSIDCYSSVDY